MDDSPDSGEALPLLGEVYRLRGTGLLLLGPESPPLGLVIRKGQIAALCPPPGPRPVPKKPRPRPEDSAELRLDQVLAEVGLARKKTSRPKSTSTTREADELREKVVAALADGAATATFEETTDVPRNSIPTTGAIETLILDALRAAEDKDRVRRILGDLDQRLVATASLAKQKKTLTLTEGYLLSRVDGLLSMREILQLVPLQSDEAETTLAALLLTGRLKLEAALHPPRKEEPRTVHARAPATAAVPEPTEEVEEEDAPTAPKIATDADPDEDDDEDDPSATGEETAPAAPSQSEDLGADGPALEDSEPEEVEAQEPAPEPAGPATAHEPAAAATSQPTDAEESVPAPEPVSTTPEQAAERQEILDLFRSLRLRNHYEILGVDRRSPEADIKKAQVALVKRYHPDMRREPYLEDLHDVLEAIFIRVGEAWEVLRNPASRATYEQYLGRAPREKESEQHSEKHSEKRSEEKGDTRVSGAGADEEQAPRPHGPDPDETLQQALVLLGTGRYWDAIQILETAMPRLESPQHRQAGQILLARAYSRNPKWVHRAVETLQEVLAENPKSADAYYELGLVYKNGGLQTRAEAMFRKALDANPRHKRASAEFNEKKPASGGLLRRLFGGKS